MGNLKDYTPLTALYIILGNAESEQTFLQLYLEFLLRADNLDELVFEYGNSKTPLKQLLTILLDRVKEMDNFLAEGREYVHWYETHHKDH